MPPIQKRPARVWPVLRAYGKAAFAYPWLLGAAVLGTIIIEAAGVTSPLYLRQFINLLSGGTPTSTVVQSLLLILATFAAINFVGWIGRRVRMMSALRLEANAMSNLYNSTFTYLLGHAHEFFISNFTGTLTRRVSRYARVFEQVFDNILFNFLSAFLFAAGIIGVLLVRNVYLGGGLLLWTAVFVYAQFKMMQKLQPLRAARTEE
ncbi:MAG: ABC transporter transmembrane domain-containing protein, partial [Candidatus Kaiserbacteria bacterium]|nr:ABC transporter transmembrane domain-containing protein [Candidatus Kaiserbacteria bacterium]